MINSPLKVVSMMLGELDYAGYRELLPGYLPEVKFLALFVYFSFCFTIALVANNLLVRTT